MPRKFRGSRGSGRLSARHKKTKEQAQIMEVYYQDKQQPPRKRKVHGHRNEPWTLVRVTTKQSPGFTRNRKTLHRYGYSGPATEDIN